MSGRGGNVFVVPLHKVPSAITGTTTNGYVSIKADFFYSKGQTRKKFSILNTHAANGMRYRIRGCSSLLTGAMVRPKIIIDTTVLPGGLTDPEVETITDSYIYVDVQVMSDVPDTAATYAVDTELASV